MADLVRASHPRLRRLAILLSRIVAWQAAVQLLGLLAGFALLRWLDVEAYAQYTLAFGFVTATSLLIDLGFVQAVVALVGERADDDEVVRAYIAGARRLRNRAMLILIPAAALTFALMTEGKGWSSDTRIGLFVSVAVTIVARSFQDFYGLPLIMRQNHADYMGPQLVANVVRILTLAASRSAGALTSVVASLASTLLSILPAMQYRRRTGRISARGQRAHEREIVSYALPLAPMLLYTALQSQLQIFAASTFGSTRVIAEVGALSRLGQVYALVGIVNSMVIMPKAARAKREDLGGVAMLSIVGAIVFVAITALSAFVAPGFFVALLGNEYESLRAEIASYLVGAGLMFISGVVFVIVSARGYLYWWLTGLLVFGVLAIQAFAALMLDLSTVSNIVIFLILTGAAQLLVALAGLWYGLRRGPRPTRRVGGVLLTPGAES